MADSIIEIIRMIKLLPCDAEDNSWIDVPYDIICVSKTIKNIIDDIGDGHPIPLTEIKRRTIEKVIIYCEECYKRNDNTHIKSYEGPQKKRKPGKVLPFDFTQWESEYLEILKEDHTLWLELINASNYLDIIPLLDLNMQLIASILKGKKPEEIRQCFNIKNDFTPEEEEAIRKENEWMDDCE